MISSEAMAPARSGALVSGARSAEVGLDARGLSKTYPNGVRALRDVSLRVSAGMYGLLGPNGAGKSTLMRTLATLQEPDEGSFSLDGIDGRVQPDRLRQGLGYLPQQIGAYPGVRADELLARFAWLKGLTDGKRREAEVSSLLERVNLASARRQVVATFSGGMLRRFGIAIALLGQPRLLIVDEPTAGFDPVERNRFHHVLADVATDAVVLLSTHIVEDIENLCERLSVLASGRIVAEGTPEALKSALEGRLFERVVPRGEPLPQSTLLSTAAPTGTRVVAEGTAAPGEGFLPHAPRLEDAYHHALRQTAAEA